jgi:hypothetical protein
VSALAQRFRSPAAAEAERWARGMQALARDLRLGRLDAAAWQQAVTRFSRTIAAGDLLAWFDLSRLAARCRSFGPGEHRIAVGLPGRKADPAPAAELALLTAGRAIPPHGHNNLASGHFVLRGTGRVRRYDRIADEPGAVVLQLAGDDPLESGACFTGSDFGSNVHWLSAGAASLVLLDLTVAVPGPPGFRHPSGRDGRLYLDPSGRTDETGLIRAPLLDAPAAVARFGAAP